METMSYEASPSRYKDGMEYRLCGRSGLRLPALSLGLWHNFGSVNDFSNAKKILLHAFDKGITHFDLANNYGPEPGTAEANFGRIMDESLRPYRDELIVSTKAGHEMWPGPYGDGSSRKNLIASLNQSLRRMRLDYVDIFYSHRYDGVTPIEETVQTLIDIVRSGKALYAGISKYPSHLAQKAYDIMENAGVHCLIYQGRYSMLSRQPEENGENGESVLDGVKKNGVGFIAFSPLAQGLLTDRYLNGIPEGSRAASGSPFLSGKDITPELLERLRRLNDFAKERSCTLSQVALRWLLDNPAVTSVLVGASSVEQLDTNLRAVETPALSPEEYQTLASLMK